MKLLDKDGLTYYTGKIKNELTDYVKNTDYATESIGGVIKPYADYSTSVNQNGRLYARVETYANYGNRPTTSFVSKGTLENVITGKGLVSNTDYASQATGGVLKVGNGLAVGSSGGASCNTLTNAQYESTTNTNYFISTGTLKNVLTAQIGDIGTILDNINNEVL